MVEAVVTVVVSVLVSDEVSLVVVSVSDEEKERVSVSLSVAEVSASDEAVSVVSAKVAVSSVSEPDKLSIDLTPLALNTQEHKTIAPISISIGTANSFLCCELLNCTFIPSSIEARVENRALL